MANIPFLGAETSVNDTPYLGSPADIANLDGVERKSDKGVANGYAPLDGSGKVPQGNLPDTASLDAEVDAKITTHNSATTSVHGIADTTNLVLTNDSRISGIAGLSINTSGGGTINTSNRGGYIITRGNDEGGVGGYIDTRAIDQSGGYINTSGNEADGGNIDTRGSSGGGRGGNINTSGGGENAGGNINTSGGTSPGGGGGSINTSAGGGSINTRGTGSIELGVTGTRTTLNGSASGSDKTITFPNTTGTIALTSDSRFTDSRAPTAHTHAISQVTNLQATLTAFAIALG
jgi:hypothetical protein